MTDEHYIMKSGMGLRLYGGLEPEAAAGLDPIEQERASAHHGVKALVSLCEELIRPRSFAVTRKWGDEEFGVFGNSRPSPWNWFVTTPLAPPDVDAPYVDAQVVEAETLDEPSMLAAVDRALDDPAGPAPDGHRLVWEELLVDHAWARLPEPERHVRNGELLLGEGPHLEPMALDRTDGHVWVSAQRLGTWHPFMLRVTKFADTDIELDIDVYWSFWWEPGEGRDMLDRAVDRLIRQGWERA